MHHISTVRNYGIARRDGVDVDITSPLSRPAQHRTSQMIVFRDHFDSFMSFEDPFGDPFSIKSVSSRSALVPRALSDEHGCSFEHTEVNQAATKYFLKRNGFFEKHNPFERRDATPSTCFGTSKRILPMAAAADCAYAAAVGTPSQVLQKILSDWNSASQVYEQTFNIALGLIQVKIMQTCGNVNGENLAWNRVCSDSYTVNDRLSDFSQWRGSKSQDNAGLWHIMTQCK